MKENEQNKIKLETKKVMAYTKASDCIDDYELYRCLHCGEEYLTQAIKESEMNFCPRHSDFAVCVWCDSTQNKKEMIKEEDGFYCKDCNSPKCSQCGVSTNNSNTQFCSVECRAEFWGDSTEY
jgi:DNA-directed RNA polymerase subunit RPC12/RpoP